MKPSGSWSITFTVAALILALARNASAAEPTANYTGAGSCASSQCHGSMRPRVENRIPQNEHTVWVTKDEHAQAYAHLLSDRSKTIARNLGMAGPPEKEARCLDCHSLNVAVERRGRTFDLADGVSCEACHGPAEQWLGPHTTRGWTHERSVALGMRDTKDPLVRAETCSTCHVGDPGRSVTHELYAAGHPELIFEMQWSTEAMPAHWKESAQRGAYFATRLWAIGEAVHLRDQMSRAARAPAGAWPEFAEYDCGACHHELMQKSWRQTRGYEGRRPGDPPIDLARWRVLAPLARKVAPETADQIDSAARDLGAARALAAEPLLRLSAAASTLAGRLSAPSTDLGRETTLWLLSALARDASPARDLGYRGAGQIAMSIDALSRPVIEATADRGKDLDGAVEKLFSALGRPDTYDPERFAAALSALGAKLEAAGASR